MLLFDGGGAIILFGVWLFCIIDVITTPESECRNLPKLVRLFLVILLMDIGSIAWLVAGRNWNRQSANLPYKGNRGLAPARPPARAGNPDDDEEFLRGLRARADEQRQRAREVPPPDEPPASPPTP
jgi:hypothetical protein